MAEPAEPDLDADPPEACLLADPLELGLVADPLEVGLVADPLELGLVAEPLEADLVAEPLEPDLVLGLERTGSTVSKVSFRGAGMKSSVSTFFDCEPDLDGFGAGDFNATSALLVGAGLTGFLVSATTGFSGVRGIVRDGASVWLGARWSALPSALEPEPAKEFEMTLLVSDAIGEIALGRMIELPGFDFCSCCRAASVKANSVDVPVGFACVPGCCNHGIGECVISAGS